jgi:hypothetical protein
MSKPYFTKYLPVEGEIKDGDMYYNETVGKTLRCLCATGFTKGDKLVKLFLCSRDIQVGDELRTLTGKETIPITGIGGDKEIEILQVGIDNKKLFKVIREISPEATWVKEWDEFDEDEYDYRYKDKHGWDIVKDINVISPQFRHLYVIGLKGPCGHFH